LLQVLTTRTLASMPLGPSTPSFLFLLAAQADTVAELVALQAEYAAWHDALPDSLRDRATAEALQAIVDLDLEELMAIVPPRGYGRD
jgi:hypothetical protein